MNIFYPPGQGKVFVIMLFFGVAIGFLYDLFKIKRRLFGQNKLILFFDDLIFSLLFVVLFLFTVFVANNGIFRWFEVVFSGIGFALYRITISVPVIFVCYKIIDLFLFILNKLLSVILFPVKRLIVLTVDLLSPLKNMYGRTKKRREIIRYAHKFL